jgi:hypothetical protein
MNHDLELNELLYLIRFESGLLNQLDRDKKTSALYEALGRIHDASRKAQWRMNDLKEKQ